MKFLVMLLLMGSASAATIELDAPRGANFGIPVCGTVQVNTYAVGFNTDGTIRGEVLAKSSCNGSGRGAVVHHYQSWHSILWDLSGRVIQMTDYDGAVPDPADTDSYAGYSIATRSVSPNGYVAYRGFLMTP